MTSSCSKAETSMNRSTGDTKAPPQPLGLTYHWYKKEEFHKLPEATKCGFNMRRDEGKRLPSCQSRKRSARSRSFSERKSANLPSSRPKHQRHLTSQRPRPTRLQKEVSPDDVSLPVQQPEGVQGAHA